MDQYAIFVWAVYGAAFLIFAVLGVSSVRVARRAKADVAALRAQRSAEREALMNPSGDAS